MIDSHCHLGIGPEWKENGRTPDILLQRAKEAGVGGILTVACDYSDYDNLKKMLKFQSVWGAFGIHPENAEKFDLNQTIDMLNAFPEIVALGEIGLDFYYGAETRQQQIKVFEQQIELAATRNLPVIIHTRDADDDTIRILETAQNGGLLKNNGVLHCFTGSKQLAEFALGIGFYISASGIITFKKANDLREIFKFIPFDRILVETDSPYLAPIPYRGKANEPAYVIETAKVLANIKQTSFDFIDNVTTSNFKKLFKIAGE